MQAHSTMRGKRPKIIDVDLLSDVSSPKCHSPKSPRIKEEELDDIEEMQVEAQVEEDVMGLSDAESDEVEEECVAVALGTVDSSNVGFHPCGNVKQHVIGFATGNAVAVIYATIMATDCYALGTHYYARAVADANAATPFGVIPSISSAIQFACVHLHTDPPNLQPMTVRPLLAGVRWPSTAMYIQKVDTLGFPTVQTDWKNSTVAPSYPPGTSGNPVLEKKFLPFFGPTSDP